jgi:hypothetical protein
MADIDQGINWKEYIDCIFVISIDYTNNTNPSTILGTFFSKNEFVIDNNTINGNDIIYKQTTDQEKYIDGDNNTTNIPNGSTTIFFVKTSKQIKSNFISDDAIYKLIGYGNITINENKEGITGITKIQKVNSFNPPSSLTGTQITTIDDATINNRSTELLKKLTLIKELLNSSQPMKGGAPDKVMFKQVIDYFQEFVNIFITDSIIFQINSLNAEQINQLFDTKFNDITINDNPVKYNRNDIKPKLFDHIYSNCYDKYVNLDVVVSSQEELSKYATHKDIHDIATKFYLFTKDTTMSNKIDDDTTIFNKIIPNTGSNTGSQKIHLYYVANSFQNFYNEDYKAISNTTSYFNGIIDNIYNIINDITNNFTENITITSSTQTITMINIIKSLHDAKNDDFRKALSNYLKENASNKIITYLKINNFEKEQYNQRFNILIKDTLGETDTKKQNAMIVEYNDHNFPYYIKNKGSIVLNETELKKNTGFFQINNQTKELTVNKYKNEYFFGNYSQIFKPDLSNEQIAEQMDVIIDQVTAGKPVFMLGYGASGSGKTSSLIYFNKGKDHEKEGILIHLCKKLQERGYDKIEVTAKEYFIVDKKKDINGSKDYCEGNNELANPIVCQDSEPYLFTYNTTSNTFTLNENTDHTTKHKYRLPNDNSETKTFTKGESIGNVMIYLIDQDRFVKATTNNPQSSRSHSMVYLKLTKTNANDIGYIIIGDYAGVENKFTCENASTIMDFLEKKRDCDNIYKNDCLPYYSNEFITDNDGKKKHDTFHDEKYGFEYDEKVDDENKSFRTMIDEFVKNNQNNQVINILYNICKMGENKKYEIYNNGNHGNIVDIFHNFLRNDTTLLTKFNEKIKFLKEKIPNLYGGNKTFHGGVASYIDYIKKIFNEARDSKDIKTLTDVLENNKTILNNSGIKTNLTDNNNLNVTYNIHYDKNFDEYFENKFKEIITKILEIFNNNDNFNDKFKNIFIKYYSYSTDSNSSPKVTQISGIKNQNEIENFFKKISDKDFIRDFFTKIFNNEEVSIKFDIKNKQFQEGSTGLNETSTNKFKELFLKEFKLDSNNLKDLVKSNQNLHQNQNKNVINLINDIEYSIDKTGFNYKGTKYEIIEYGTINDQLQNYQKGKKYLENIKKSYFSELYKDIDNKTEDQLIKLEKKIMNSLSDDMESITNFINDIHKRLDYGKIICSNRVFEGEFINKSLQDIRDTIKDIITVKSEGIVFNSPDYIDICLKQYCPTHTDCFKTPLLKDKYDNIDSVLIRSIYEYLKKDQEKENYSVKDFYKDILVSVFCVFNISREANNPPSVPYIDINLLKIHMAIYEKTKEEYVKKETMDKIKSELNRLYYKLNHGKNFEGTTYTDETTFEQNQVSVILNSDEYKQIYTDKNYDSSVLKNFIETIDNNNAISAIGTLEFLDQIAKYNTANTICSRLDALSPDAIQNYRDTRRFDDLYQKIQ